MPSVLTMIVIGLASPAFLEPGFPPGLRTPIFVITLLSLSASIVYWMLCC